MPARHYFRPADLLDFPEDGNKYEVVHGELLVTPAPRKLHQLVVTRLVIALGQYLERFPAGQVYPGGDVLAGEDTLVIPDLLVLDLQAARHPGWDVGVPPLLVVEVLSPSHARQDRFTKRRLYQEMGVPLYWLVDVDANIVEVWIPDAQSPTTAHDQIQWHPEGATEALVIRLVELFREV